MAVMGLLTIYFLKLYIRLRNRVGHYLESLTLHMVLHWTNRTVLYMQCILYIHCGDISIVQHLFSFENTVIKIVPFVKKFDLPLKSSSPFTPKAWRVQNNKITNHTVFSVCTILGERNILIYLKVKYQVNVTCWKSKSLIQEKQ